MALPGKRLACTRKLSIWLERTQLGTDSRNKVILLRAKIQYRAVVFDVSKIARSQNLILTTIEGTRSASMVVPVSAGTSKDLNLVLHSQLLLDLLLNPTRKGPHVPRRRRLRLPRRRRLRLMQERQIQALALQRQRHLHRVQPDLWSPAEQHRRRTAGLFSQ